MHLKFLLFFCQMGQAFLIIESHSQPGEQLMRAKEGISYPLKGFGSDPLGQYLVPPALEQDRVTLVGKDSGKI